MHLGLYLPRHRVFLGLLYIHWKSGNSYVEFSFLSLCRSHGNRRNYVRTNSEIDQDTSYRGLYEATSKLEAPPLISDAKVFLLYTTVLLSLLPLLGSIARNRRLCNKAFHHNNNNTPLSTESQRIDSTPGDSGNSLASDRRSPSTVSSKIEVEVPNPQWTTAEHPSYGDNAREVGWEQESKDLRSHPKSSGETGELWTFNEVLSDVLRSQRQS